MFELSFQLHQMKKDYKVLNLGHFYLNKIILISIIFKSIFINIYL